MIYLEAASALALVLGLLGLFYYLAQRFNIRRSGGSSQRQIRVVERTSLGDKRSLLIVRVGQEQFLLGATSSTISMLSSIVCDSFSDTADSEEEASEKPVSKISFRKILEAIR